MNYKPSILVAIVFILVAVISACTGAAEKVTTSEEESGIKLTLDETYDRVRNGARLILAYDSQSNSFIGTVENTTDNTLKQVRVEVHLSNGMELGPTKPADLKPGEKIKVTLIATSEGFKWWTAHPEVGESEHGEGERDGEHTGEGEGEHE